jgi:hypothetical protein
MRGSRPAPPAGHSPAPGEGEEEIKLRPFDFSVETLQRLLAHNL